MPQTLGEINIKKPLHKSTLASVSDQNGLTSLGCRCVLGFGLVTIVLGETDSPE